MVHGSWFMVFGENRYLVGEDLAAALHRHWTAIDRMNDYGLINNDGYVMTCWGYGIGWDGTNGALHQSMVGICSRNTDIHTDRHG
jgi:hypothetical protein